MVTTVAGARAGWCLTQHPVQLVEDVLTEIDVHWVCGMVVEVVDAVVIIGD